MSTLNEESNFENMPYGLLISAVYNNQKKATVLKFYEPTSEKIFLWTDKSGHKPYCYTKLSSEDIPTDISERDDVIEIKPVERFNLLEDKTITVSKILVKDPLAIGGTQTNKSIRNLIETWESDIKYYENYLYDNQLIVGKYYKIENDHVVPFDLKISSETKLSLKKMLWDKLDNTDLPNPDEFEEHVSQWADLLNQPIPKIKRISLDIEVESEIGASLILKQQTERLLL